MTAFVPQGWQLASLGEVCLRNTGIRDPRAAAEESFLYVDISSVDNQAKKIIAPKTLLGRSAPSRARQVMRANDILVATTRPNLNAVARVPLELDRQVCSTGFCVLRPIDAKLNADFLFAFVQSTAFVNALSDLVKGALYPAVTDAQVLDQRIPLPSLSEQKRIAALLNERMAMLTGARESQGECLKLAAAFSTSYLQSIFPVGLGDALHGTSDWRRVALGDAGDVVSGVTVGRQLREPTSRRVPYLRVANVKDGYLDLAEIKQIDVTEAEFQKWQLRDGDILLTEGGDLDKLGRGTFWSEQIPNCIHQNHIFRVRFKSDEVYPPFVAAQLGSPYGKAYFLRHAKKTTGIASINQKVLRGFPLLVPPIGEQRRIAERLRSQQEAAAAMTAEFRQQSEALDRLPAAFLRRAFAGSV